MSDFTLARFAAHVGERFELVGVPELAWTLAEADGIGAVADPATHTAFSLVFHGAREPLLAQQMVTLAHPVLGEIPLFMTPIAQDADGVSYQAVFN